MIALVVTILVATYVLGPDLLARWILGFVVPRKNLVLSKSEELTRGIMWSVVPFFIAWRFRHLGPWSLPPNSRLDVQVFFSGLYSDAFFSQHRLEFFSSAGSALQLYWCLTVRLYLVVLLAGGTFNYLIKKYGPIREWLSHRKGIWSFARWVLAVFVLPRIAEWHVILSSILLPSTKMSIELDVLTKGGIMYSGRLADKMLMADGSLESLTLEGPRRFRREQYLEAKKSDPQVAATPFWKDIPGNLFVIIASEISTLNVRYIPPVRRFGETFEDIRKALRELDKKLQAIPGRAGPTKS